MTILIVDDDKGMRSILTATLRSFYPEDLEILTAGSLADANALALSGELEGLDVLVTDVDLGHADDGLAVARWARNADPTVRLIVCSSQTEDHPSVRGLMALGAKRFDKPLTSLQAFADAVVVG